MAITITKCEYRTSGAGTDLITIEADVSSDCTDVQIRITPSNSPLPPIFHPSNGKVTISDLNVGTGMIQPNTQICVRCVVREGEAWVVAEEKCCTPTQVTDGGGW